MLDCIVLGDSIAVGVGQARPECRTFAASGINSEHFLQTLPDAEAHTVVISLGVNDSDGVATADNLAKLRARVSADTVYWLVSGPDPRIRDAVRAIAGRFGDRLIDVTPLAGADHIHPDRAGYAHLAAATRGIDPGSATQASDVQKPPAQPDLYRAFPGLKVWNGPDNLNGVPVRQ